MIFETNYYQASGLHSHSQPEGVPVTPSSSNSPNYEPAKRPVSSLSPSSLQTTPVSLKRGSALKTNCKKSVRISNDDMELNEDSLCKVELAETPQSLSMCSSSSSTSFSAGQSQSPVNHAAVPITTLPNSTILYQIQSSDQLPYEELVEPIHTIFTTTTTPNPTPTPAPAEHATNPNCYLEPSGSGSVSFPTPLPLSHVSHHTDYQLPSYPVSYASYMSLPELSAVEPTTYASTSSYSHSYYQHQQQHVEAAEYHVTSGAYRTSQQQQQDYQYQYAQPGEYTNGQNVQGAIYDSYCEDGGFYLNNQHHQLSQPGYDMETPVNYAAPYQDYTSHGIYQQRFDTDEESGLDSDSDSCDSMAGDEDSEQLIFHGQQQLNGRRAYNKKKPGNAAATAGSAAKAKTTKRARKLKQSLEEQDLLADGDMSQAAKRKRKRILNRLQRAEATMREKRRMLKLNRAFEDLRKVLPITEFAKNKLSRADTLKSAIEYIEKMSEMLTLS